MLSPSPAALWWGEDACIYLFLFYKRSNNALDQDDPEAREREEGYSAINIIPYKSQAVAPSAAQKTKLPSVRLTGGTHRNIPEEGAALRLLLLDEVIEELHEGLLALEVGEVGQRLQCLGNQCQVPNGPLIREFYQVKKEKKMVNTYFFITYAYMCVLIMQRYQR